MTEVGGNAVIQIDPYSSNTIVDALLQLERDDPALQEIIGLGLERARKFSWASCADQTFGAYKSVI